MCVCVCICIHISYVFIHHLYICIYLPIWNPDTSPTDTSPTGQLRDRLFPDLTFPLPDTFSNGYFPEQIFPRLHISPATHFPILYILFPSRHFLDAK